MDNTITTEDNIISINKVCQQYKGAESESLKKVSLKIKRGETLLLCGASGSGKTSLIRLINGLVPHYYKGEMTGEVTVAGKDISKTELHELAGIVGTVFQNPRSQFFSVDTDGEIVFGPENIGLEPSEIKKRKEDIVQKMNIENLLERSLFDLSGGEKQRIACASVAALLPDIILLDEPSSNLDIDAIENLRDIIIGWKNEGKTIIISEHRLWYIKDLVDRVLYINNGHIKKEWNKEEFNNLPSKEIEEYKLRPLNIRTDYFRFLDEDNKSDNENNLSNFNDIENTTDSIILRDFYFSYNKKAYLLFKKKFKGSDGKALQLNIPYLSLPKGKVIGVIGHNGTGKSTFLRCVCGLERDCKGTIEDNGKIYKGSHKINYSYMVMQDVNHQLFTDSVEAEVLLSMKEKNNEKCEDILESLGLAEYKDKHPMALSGGQKQRVAIASAFAAGANLLLFDEPTSGLDYSHMEKVGALLRELAERGKTVLVSTHDSELIETCCDYTLYIEKGQAISLEKV